MSRRNGGFLEFLSLLLVYGIVSRFIQIKRTEGVLFPIEAERALGTIVSMINIVLMLIAMCVCIYQMGTFGIIMGVIICLSISLLGQLVVLMVEIKLTVRKWKLFYVFVFLSIVILSIYIKSVTLAPVSCALIGAEIFIVNLILNKYSKKQYAGIGAAADNNEGKKDECGSQLFRAKKGAIWVPDDGVADLLRGVSLSECMRYLNVDSVGELIEKFPNCIDEDDAADFREGEKSIVRAKRRVVAEKYRFMPADFDPNLVVPVATVTASAVAMCGDDDDDDNGRYAELSAHESTRQASPYNNTDKYDKVYDLREVDYINEYGDDYEDAIDDRFDELNSKR